MKHTEAAKIPIRYSFTKSHSHIQGRAKPDEHMLEYHDKYYIQNEELLKFSIPLSFFGKQIYIYIYI